MAAPATRRASVTVWQGMSPPADGIDWDRVSHPAATVFETWPWFRNLAEACYPNDAAQILAIETAAGRTLLPLRRDGARIESLSNYYASLFGPVATEPQALAAHAEQCAQWLAGCGAGTIQLHPLAEHTPFFEALAAGLRARGCWVDRYFAFGNWYQPCAGMSWAQYLEARPSRLRNTIVRTRKKLKADPAFKFELLDGRSDAEQLERAIAGFQAVYDKSWKQSEPYPRFIPGLLRMAHQQGWLRMGMGYLDDAPAAGQIWFVKSGIASIFKLAYDGQHAKRGIGTVISAALTEHVLDVDQVGEIDFLTGDDEYKKEWMACRRERFGLIAFQPKTLSGLIAGSRHFAGRWLRNRRRRADPPAPAVTAAETD